MSNIVPFNDGSFDDILPYLYEDRDSNIRLKIQGFIIFAKISNGILFLYDLRNENSEMFKYLSIDCEIPVDEIKSWETKGILDIFVPDLLAYQLKFNNKYAGKLNRVFSAYGSKNFFRGIAGLPINSHLEGVQRLLNGVAEIPFPWELEFDDNFYKAVFRLYDYSEKHQCGLFIKTYIYKWFPHVVNQKLDDVDPIIDGRFRRHKLHQFFKGETLRALRTHIMLVTNVLNSSNSQYEFKHRMKSIPKIITHYQLPRGNNNDGKQRRLNG